MYDIKKRPLGIYEKALPNDFTWLEKMQAAKQAGYGSWRNRQHDRRRAYRPLSGQSRVLFPVFRRRQGPAGCL